MGLALTGLTLVSLLDAGGQVSRTALIRHEADNARYVAEGMGYNRDAPPNSSEINKLQQVLQDVESVSYPSNSEHRTWLYRWVSHESGRQIVWAIEIGGAKTASDPEIVDCEITGNEETGLGVRIVYDNPGVIIPSCDGNCVLISEP